MASLPGTERAFVETRSVAVTISTGVRLASRQYVPLQMGGTTRWNRGVASSPLGAPVERQHASDRVFKQLALAVLSRELPPGAVLPPERELAEQFGVSRIVVREAIHRLKEVELARVRQGSPTVILDPDEATDIRLLALEIDLMSEEDEEGIRAVAERQRYAAAALLALAEQRMEDDDIDALETRTREHRALADRPADELAYERDFWLAIARGSHNRIYLRETLWFFNVLARDERFRSAMFMRSDDRLALYETLIGLLRQRRGVADAYLTGIRAIDTLESQTRP